MDVLPKQDLRARDYPCLSCPYKSNKACSRCLFADWNVNGIMAGFHPKPQYRLRNRADLSASPLVQTTREVKALNPRLSRLVIPSYNRISQVLKNLRV
jgi:hypothetical protein